MLNPVSQRIEKMLYRPSVEDDVENIPCRPEKCLTMSASGICDDLWSRLEKKTDRKYWRKFEKSINNILAMNYDRLGNSVRSSLEILRMGETEEKHLKPTLRAIGKNLKTLFEASQYVPLGRYSYCHAVDSVFEFDYVTEVMWDRLDKTYIGETEHFHRNDSSVSSCFSSPLAYHHNASFKEKRRDSGKEFDCLQEHMRVYLRGRQDIKKTGFFLWEKINCFLTMMAVSQPVETPQTLDCKTNKNAIWVQRRSLRKIVEKYGFFTTLFQNVTIAEPAFTHVCTVYRNAPTKENSNAELCITLYRNIAFGDLEAVFPHKRVNRKPVDHLFFIPNCLFTFYCLVGTFLGFWFNDNEIEMWKIFSTFCVMLRILKSLYSLFIKYTGQKKKNAEDVRKFVERKQAAQDMPVVSELVDEAKQQDFKVIILTYWFLWQLGDLDERELDDTVEVYLKNHLHNKNIDFDHFSGLNRLETLGLVTLLPNGKYHITKTPREWISAKRIPHFQDLREVFTSSETPITQHQESFVVTHTSDSQFTRNPKRPVRK